MRKHQFWNEFMSYLTKRLKFIMYCCKWWYLVHFGNWVVFRKPSCSYFGYIWFHNVLNTHGFHINSALFHLREVNISIMVYVYIPFQYLLPFLITTPCFICTISSDNWTQVIVAMTTLATKMGGSKNVNELGAKAADKLQKSNSGFKRWGRRTPFIRYGLPMLSFMVFGTVGLGHILQGR